MPLHLLFLPPRMSVPFSEGQDPTAPERLPPPGRPLGFPPFPGVVLSSLPALITTHLVSDPLVSWVCLSTGLCLADELGAFQLWLPCAFWAGGGGQDNTGGIAEAWEAPGALILSQAPTWP